MFASPVIIDSGVFASPVIIDSGVISFNFYVYSHGRYVINILIFFIVGYFILSSTPHRQFLVVIECINTWSHSYYSRI